MPLKLSGKSRNDGELILQTNLITSNKQTVLVVDGIARQSCHISHFIFFILYRSWSNLQFVGLLIMKLLKVSTPKGTLESISFGQAVSRLHGYQFVPMLHKSSSARDDQKHLFVVFWPFALF